MLRFFSYLSLSLCALWLFGVACGDGSSRGGSDSSGNSSSSSGGSMREDTVSVPAGATKFAIVGRVNSGAIRFDKIRDPDGREVVSTGGELVTLATQAEAKIATANIPSREKDGSITTGDYTVVSELSESQDINFMVLSSPDGDLSSGLLVLNIISVGGPGRESSVQSALDQALPIVSEIYARTSGISLIVNRSIVDGPNSIPAPQFPSSFYESTTNSTPVNAVNVFIAGDISEIPIGALGIASSIPGPPIPSDRSAVVISIFESAGADGVISGAEEIRLFAETIAHEAGHYLGLFHPVEIDPLGNVGGNDPLDDTERCGNFDSCVSNDSLRRNLMFPFPVSQANGSLIPQNQLTSDQRGVVNRNILVQ